MVGIHFTVLFYLALFFICKGSSEDCVPPFCSDLSDTCHESDSEGPPYFTVDSNPKCDVNTVTESVLEDSTPSCDNLLTEIPEEISTGPLRQKESSTAADVKNDEDTVKVEKPKSGSFNASPKTIVFLVVCAILALPFIDGVYRCLFNRNRNASETDSNATFISYDVPEIPEDITIGTIIVRGINRSVDFFLHPFRTLAQQIREPVNVSTIEVVEISLSSNSETESPERDGIQDSSDRDMNDAQDDGTSNSTNSYMSMIASNSSDSVPTSYYSCQETETDI